MIFFTSDLHLDHTNMIEYSNRPFKDTIEMNKEIALRWNKKVQPMDTVYVLGDVCWGWNSKQIKEYFDKLNGIKYLIYGNHDKLGPHKLSKVWKEIVNYKEIRIENQRFVLTHCPLADWVGMYDKNPSIQLYGHVHNNSCLMDLLDKEKYMFYNVGVDVNDFEPISYEKIKNLFDNILHK